MLPLKKFRTLIDVILNFYALHNSVWVDLWPYSNAYVRPGTRASMKMPSLVAIEPPFLTFDENENAVNKALDQLNTVTRIVRPTKIC